MNPLTLLQRALAADPHELTTRLAQAQFVSANRRAAQSGRSAFPAGAHLVSLGESSDTLRRWFAGRKRRWFLDPDRRERIRELYEERDLERSLILRRADVIVSGKMPIFSHEPVEFNGAERWRRDHILGVTAPQAFYGDIEYLNIAQVGDSKNIWEPNRFGWVYWLGQAHVITGDAVYADTFRALLLDWRAQNPYPLGVNYCSALELSFRAYALIWALDLFADLFVQDAELLDTALEIIWVSCSHIERSLSYYFAPNTHLTGEAFGLFACGAALPEIAESAHWRRLGLEILCAEADKQFHADGTHRELSTCYHLYSTDFYLHAALIARHTGFAAPAQLERTARTLAARLAEMAPEDLHLPQINDCDGGRLSWFAFHPLDAAPALFAAQELWDDFELPLTDRHAAGYALWMTDVLAAPSGSRETSERRQVMESRSARSRERDYRECDSGIIIYKNSDHDYLLVRAGSFGYLDCGHSHDAQLSVVLYFAGRPALVDCGTGAYTQSREIRDRFRSGTGKNILLVNQAGPSEPGDWFTWRRTTAAHVTGARDFEGGFYFKARHNGYSASCGFPVEISREVILLDEGLCLLIDSWRAERPIHTSLNLTPHSSLAISTSGRMLYEEDGVEFHYLVSPQFTIENAGQSADVTEDAAQPPADTSKGTEEIDLVRFRPRIIPGPYSRDYGVMGEAPVLHSDFGDRANGAVVTVLSRIGAILPGADPAWFVIGAAERERTLHVGASGKISLSALIHGKERRDSVEFAR